MLHIQSRTLRVTKEKNFVLKMQTGKAERVCEEAGAGRVVGTKNGTSIRELFGSRSTDDGGGENLCSI